MHGPTSAAPASSIPLGLHLGINGYGLFGRQPEEDLDSVLVAVRSAGFDGVEIMTNLLGRPGPVSELLARHGLSCAGMHAFLNDLDNEWTLDGVLQFMGNIGCRRLLFSAFGQTTAADYVELAKRLERLGSECAGHGVDVFFHPHGSEWSAVDGVRTGMDIVAERTDPRLVRVALDTYWAYAGGQDPVALIERWRDRSGYYHAKDGNEHGVTELGKGRIAMGAFLAGALRAPVEWVVVEQDTPDPAPAEASRRIRRHVAGLELGVPLGRRPPPEAPQADARR